MKAATASPYTATLSAWPAVESAEKEIRRASAGYPVKKLEPLYTVAETAKILNVSEKTVRRLIKDGLLRSIGFRREDGRRGPVRVAPADLEDFIRDHRSR